MHFEPSMQPAQPAEFGGSGTAMAAYVRAIRRHPLVVIGVIGVCVGAALATIAMRDPSYEATAKILVTPIPSGDRSLESLPLPRVVGDPERAVETAAKVIEGPDTAAAAAEQIGTVNANFVGGVVTVDADADANVVNVKAKTGDPELSARVANEYARAALEVRAEELRPYVARAIDRTERLLEVETDPTVIEALQDRLTALRSIEDGTDPTLSFAQSAAVPTAPLGLAPRLIVVVAVVAGFALGTVAALLIELLVARRVQDEDDVLGAYPVPVLSRLPVLGPLATEAEELLLDTPRPAAAAFRLLRARLEQQGPMNPLGHRDATDGARGVVVAVISGADGDGRTSTAIGLAQAAWKMGESALLVDLDLHGPTLSRLAAGSAGGLEAALEEPWKATDAVAPIGSAPEVGLLRAPSKPGQVERLIERVPDVLGEARRSFEWVIVDTPPLAENPDMLTVLASCDRLVIVSRIDHTPERALAAVRDLLEAFGGAPAGHAVIGGTVAGGPAPPRLVRRRRAVSGRRRAVSH